MYCHMIGDWGSSCGYHVGIPNQGLRIHPNSIVKGSLGGETSVLRTYRMSGKELVKERGSKERVRQGKS